MRMNGFKIGILTSLLLVIHGRSFAQIDTNFHIYLLAGQSNMAGRGIVDSASKQMDAHIFMLNKSNEWVPATDPVHFDKSVAGVGPAISFAKEMIQNSPNAKIGLVPAAVGGSPIRVWEPDSMFIGVHPYDDAIKRTEAAVQKGVLKGILWHQGESDNSPQGAEVYLSKLTVLIQRFRTVFHNNTLPFVAGELGYFHKDHINKVLAKLPAAVAFTAVVSAEGLTANPDNIHFNTASARALGKRYASKMLALLQAK